MSYKHLNSFQVICQKPQGDPLAKITPLGVLADSSVKSFFSFVESADSDAAWLADGWVTRPLAISPFSAPTSISQAVFLAPVPTPIVLSLGKVLTQIEKEQDAFFLPKASRAAVTRLRLWPGCGCDQGLGLQPSGSFSCSLQAEDMWRLKTDSLNTVKSHLPLGRSPCTSRVARSPVGGPLSWSNRRRYCVEPVEPGWVQSWLLSSKSAPSLTSRLTSGKFLNLSEP